MFKVFSGKNFGNCLVGLILLGVMLVSIKFSSISLAFSQNEKTQFHVAQVQNIPVQGGIPRDKEQWDIEDYNKINARPPSENLEVIQYLEPNLKSLPSPYLYEYANRLMAIDEAKALIWVQVARFRARYDSLLCSDTSSRQGISFGPLAYPEIHKLFLNDKEKYLESLISALEIEKTFPEESKPMWICVHGAVNVLFGMKGETFKDWQIPVEERSEKREEVRALLYKKIDQLKADLNK